MEGAEYEELLGKRTLNFIHTASAQEAGDEPQEAKSLSARVVTGKDDKYKTFCHFFNNRSSCKNGDSCKFRHEDSLKCKQDKDCTNRICQFQHSKKLKPQEAQSLSTRVLMGEVTVPLKKDDKYKKFCHFFNSQNSCKNGDSCKFRHEDNNKTYKDN